MRGDNMELGGEEFFYRSTDGTRLSGRDYGPRITDLAPVICLPGLTRNVRDFDAVARYLSSRSPHPRRVISFDYRGRGKSDHAPAATYTPQVEAGDVLAGMTARGIEEADFIGTSRGGLLCMAIGAMRPGVLKNVVLNDIGPVIQVSYLAGIKDYVSGKKVPENWQEAARDLKASMADGFEALDAGDWIRFARQLFDDRDGAPALAFDTALATTLEPFTSTTSPISIWPQFRTLAANPVLVLRGANSTLLEQTTFQAMGRDSHRVELYVVPKQGHAPLLWDQETQCRIARFLDSHAETNH